MSSGQFIGGAVGAVAGFFVGGPTGALYGAQIGIAAGGLLDPPKGPNQQGPRLQDLSVQTATYGAVVPKSYAKVVVSGNVFWLENDEIKEVSNTESQGGKGGTPSSEVTTYSYFATFAVGLAQGEQSAIARMWVGPNLIYDANATDINEIIASNEAASSFTFYQGTEDQEADPRIQADRGVADTPAYTGLSYVVLHDLPLAEYGNTMQGAGVRVELVSVATQPGMVQIGRNEIDRVTVGNVFHGEPRFINVFDNSFVEGDWDNSYPNEGTLYGSAIPSSTNQFHTSIDERDDLNALENSIPPTGTTDEPEGGSWQGRVDVFGEGIIGVSANSFKDTAGHFRIQDNFVYGAGTGTFEVVLGLFGRNSTPIAYSTGALEPAAITPNPAGDFYVLYDNSDIGLYDKGFNEIDYTSDFSFPFINASEGRLRVADGYLWFCNQGNQRDLFRIELDLSESIYFGKIPIDPPPTGTSGVFDFDVSEGTLVCCWPQWTSEPRQFHTAWVSLDSLDEGEVTLGEIVTDLCLDSGQLSVGDLDTSELTDIVDGYRVTASGSIRASIEPLQAVYPFDVVQRGYTIAFRKRGRTSIADIAYGDLGARQGGDTLANRLTISREQDTQLPQRVSVGYLDKKREYDAGEQHAERLSTESVNVRTLELPVVLTADAAAQRADVLMSVYWLERTDLTFTLSLDFNSLEPSDVVTITDQQRREYETRLTAIDYTSDDRLACKGKLNNVSAYNSSAQGDEGDSQTGPVQQKGPSQYVVVDGPVVGNLEEMDAAGSLGTMAGFSEGWPGGIIYQSLDDGQNWTALAAFSGAGRFGNTSDPLADGGIYDAVDIEGSLDAQLTADSLSSVTYDQMLNGANTFAYGVEGRWEIIGVQTIVDNGSNQYTFTNFLRGRYGSEWAADLHQLGDLIVKLDVAKGVQFMGFNLTATLETPVVYRGITTGRTIDSDANRTRTYEGENLRPLSPVFLNGSRDAVTDDWALDWIRRDRLGAQWPNFTDVPMSESTESYEVEIFEDNTYTTVKRTISSTTPDAAYTSAEQVADFGSNQATLYVKIYQLSASVGRGRPLTDEITRGV